MAANTGQPLCHFNRPDETYTSCQLGVMAITNKGFSKEEIQRLPPEGWGRGGSKCSCLVRVRWRNTKGKMINPGKLFLNVAQQEFGWGGA